MKILLQIVAVLALCAPADMPAGLAEMMEAERAFAQRCAEVGVNRSFQEYLLPTAIVFAPGPIEAAKVFQGQERGNADLFWWPTYGDVSSSGSLGYLTGPYLRSGDGERSAERGMYFSIWERQADGAWRVALDAGLPMLFDPTASNRDFQPARTSVPEGQPISAEGQEHLRAEEAFARVGAEGLSGAFRQFADPSIRLHRQGRRPIVGAEDAAFDLAARPRVALTMIQAKVSGDLAFAYGAYRERRDRPARTEDGYYVHVWRRNAKGKWKLVFDSFHPSPSVAVSSILPLR